MGVGRKGGGIDRFHLGKATKRKGLRGGFAKEVPGELNGEAEKGFKRSAWHHKNGVGVSASLGADASSATRKNPLGGKGQEKREL